MHELDEEIFPADSESESRPSPSPGPLSTVTVTVTVCDRDYHDTSSESCPPFSESEPLSHGPSPPPLAL
jgi:hypothetical protein